jgi:DNA-binding NtrC family response regulator
MTSEVSALRVLVVDDEPLICWSVAETLTVYGDSVIAAANGADAIRAIVAAPERLDVVLLDYRLPDCSALAVLAMVKCLAPRCRVILMSAFCTAEIVKNALMIGACRVVSKPINMHDVPGLVHGAAGLRPH